MAMAMVTNAQSKVSTLVRIRIPADVDGAGASVAPVLE